MNKFTKKKHKLISLIKYTNYIFNSFPKGLISFTFDDFHISASRFGMSILMDHDIKGTFYTSLSLKKQKNDGNSYFTINDLDNVVTQGNEIGCHTYNHLSAYDVDSNTYIQDTLKNIDSLINLYPSIDISSFAYPFGNVTPDIKKELSHIFSSCRGVDHPGIFISSYIVMDLFYIITFTPL